MPQHKYISKERFDTTLRNDFKYILLILTSLSRRKKRREVKNISKLSFPPVKLTNYPPPANKDI